MAGIKLPNNYDHLCRGAYTTNAGDNVKVDIAALFKLMESIPSPPKLYIMDFKLFANNMLPENTIIMSNDIAEALEEAISDSKDSNKCRAPYGETCTCFHCQMIERDVNKAEEDRKSNETV